MIALAFASVRWGSVTTLVKRAATADNRLMQSREILRAALVEASLTLEAFLSDEENLRAVERFANAACATLTRGGRIYVCGNGGSMSDAMHFAEELSGRFRKERAALSALSFSDPATLSCIANDFGYEEVLRVRSKLTDGRGISSSHSRRPASPPISSLRRASRVS